MLLGIIFALAGAGYIFKAWDLLFASDGVVAGAGYTDIHAALPGMRIMMVIGWALGALLIANGFWRRRWRWPLYGIGGWVVALIVVRVIFPALVQTLVVSPNQQAKESPYIAYNIAATRSAYGLDKINQTQYPLTGDLNTAKLVVNSATDSQHPPVGPEHPAHQLRAAAAIASLLRVHDGRRRPLRRQRRVPRDHAGAA